MKSISGIFARTSKAATPTVLKIVIVLQIWFLLSGLSTTLQRPLMQDQPLSSWMVLFAGMMALQILVLIGIWRLRKWAVVVFAGMAALSLLQVTVLTTMSARVVLAVWVLRAIVLVPALLYWRRMT